MHTWISIPKREDFTMFVFVQTNLQTDEYRAVPVGTWLESENCWSVAVCRCNVSVWLV